MLQTLEQLETRRYALLKELSQTGDIRQGSITEHYRQCGKDACCCCDPKHPGHGPYYAFTKKVDGKTKTLQLRQGPRLSKIEREVAAYKDFRKTCEELVKINEKICDLRPMENLRAQTPSTEFKKKLLRKLGRKSRGKRSV